MEKLKLPEKFTRPDLRLERRQGELLINFRADTEKYAFIYRNAIEDVLNEKVSFLIHKKDNGNIEKDDDYIGFHEWTIIGDLEEKEFENIINDIHKQAEEKYSNELAYS
jgi:hypothetical protein